MKEKTCFFIGHRNASEKAFPLLQGTVNYHIEDYGVTHFLVGNYGSFDRLAARAVINAKQKYEGITLSLLLPYHPVERPVEKPIGFDELFYLEGMEKVPKKVAIVRANQYAVDHSDYLISYVWQLGSDTRNVVEYARKRAQRGLIQMTIMNPMD